MRNALLFAGLCALIVLFPSCRTKTGTMQSSNNSDNTRPAKLQAATYDDAEAYSVYRALLAHPIDALIAINGEKQDDPEESRWPVAIASLTGLEELCFDPATQPDSRIREAAADYMKQNSEPRLLKAKEFGSNPKIELISTSDLHSILADGPVARWKKFHEIHPEVQGYTEFSAVGFSADKNFAVVFLSRYCGPTCGAGGVSTLERKNGAWQRTKPFELCSWTS